MLIKGVKDEDFINYKIASMFVICKSCTFKCDILNCKHVCQNSEIARLPNIEVDTEDLIKRYLENDITKAIVFGGLEPIDQFNDIVDFVQMLRHKYRCNDTVIIYTGYEKDEILKEIDRMRDYDNIIIKFGRYIYGMDKRYDDVLGVQLASSNQFAEYIS